METVYLDTHVLLWLCSYDFDFLSPRVIQLIENSSLLISPAVELELQYLDEKGRLERSVKGILKKIQLDFDVRFCENRFRSVINECYNHVWTRDPFDRIITAQAALQKKQLITKDETILKNYKYAVWN